MSNIKSVTIDGIARNWKPVGPVVAIPAKDISYNHSLVVNGEAEYIKGVSTSNTGIVTIRLGNGEQVVTTRDALVEVRKFQNAR